MRLKLASLIFVFVFVGGFFYLGWNNFEVPTFFWFQETDEVVGVVIKTSPVIRGRGYYQMVDYEYAVADSVYLNYFIAGKRQGQKRIGDSVFIEYSVDSPHKSRVVGF